MHHKGRNKHHFEYWTDYDPKRGGVWPVKMPLVYVVEMFCDRVAADKIYNGKNYSQAHPLEYFERGKGVRVIHPETSQLLEKLLRMLKDDGEDATFEYIRKILLKEKEYYDIGNKTADADGNIPVGFLLSGTGAPLPTQKLPLGKALCREGAIFMTVVISIRL